MLRLCWLIPLLLPAWAQAIAPSDFAFGRELQEGGGSIRFITLPPEIYRRVRRDDLGDLRVFNATGQPLPSLLREPEPRATEQQQSRDLAFYPLPGPSSTERPLGGLELDVELDARGEILRLHGRVPLAGPAAPTDTAAPGAYLIDNEGAEGLPAPTLKLAWESREPQLFARLRVDGSDNLVDWERIVDDAAISALDHQGTRLLRERVELPRQRRFLRLQWRGPTPTLRISAITAEYREWVAEPGPAPWLQIDPLQRDAESGDYTFDSGGPFPLTRLRLEPRADGMLYTGRIWSRPSTKAPWTPRGSFRQYRLQLGTERVESDPIRLPGVGDRLWRIAFDTPQQPRPEDLPLVTARYLPSQLLFFAQGDPPYLLAYGNPGVGRDAPTLAGLLAEMAGPPPMIGEVTLGPERPLGGGEPAPKPFPWQRWLLWGVLILGVVLLIRMARSLLREIQPRDPGG